MDKVAGIKNFWEHWFSMLWQILRSILMIKYNPQWLTTIYHHKLYRTLRTCCFLTWVWPPPPLWIMLENCKIGTRYSGTSIYQDCKIQNMLFDSYSPALCGNPGQFHTRWPPLTNKRALPEVGLPWFQKFLCFWLLNLFKSFSLMPKKSNLEWAVFDKGLCTHVYEVLE